MGLFLPSLKYEDILKQVQTLLEQDKVQEALKLIQKAEKRNIFHSELFLAKAKVHKLLGDTQAHHTAIASFIKENERDVTHHLKIVEEEIVQNDFEYAQKHLDDIKRRFPLSGHTHALQASIHCHQANWDGAAKALLEKQVYGKLDDRDTALVHLIRKGAAKQQIAAVEQLFATDQVKEIVRREVYEHFESLGTDCEFGFIQRENGREPLTLFRWGHIPFEGMVRLFNQRLENFITKDTTRLKLSLNEATGNAEYYFREDIYQFGSHTFYTKKNTDINTTEESLHNKALAHFSFIKRKLQEDLEDANKIFVYKSKEVLSLEQCQLLSQALRQMGDNKLLVVMLGTLEDGEAKMEYLADNLMIGKMPLWYINHMDKPAEKLFAKLCWDTLVQKAYQHFRPQTQSLEAAIWVQQKLFLKSFKSF